MSRPDPYRDIRWLEGQPVHEGDAIRLEHTDGTIEWLEQAGTLVLPAPPDDDDDDGAA